MPIGDITSSSPRATSISVTPEELEDDAPRSIASLRSKFENLAAGGSAGSGTPNGGGPSNGSTSKGFTGERGRLLSERSSAVAAPPVHARSLSLNGHFEGQTSAPKAPPPKPTSRPVTPTPSASLSPSPSFLPTATSKPPPAAPPSRPITPKPAFHTVNYGSGSSIEPPHLGEDSSSSLLKPSDSLSQTPTTSPAVTSSSTFSDAPKLIRRHAPPVPSKPSSVVATPTGSDDGLEAAPEPEPAISVKALRDRFNIQPNAEASGSNGHLAKSVSADGLPKNMTIPMTNKQFSAPSLKQTSADGMTEKDIPLSPGSDLPPTEDPTAIEPIKHPPPPPPPVSRSASPAPPAPNRAHKPVLNRNHSPPLSSSHDDQPPPPSRQPVAPPQLPVRRPTIASPEVIDHLPPPPRIPGNKPILSPALPVSTSNSTDSSSAPPPPLPTRSRANTIGRPERDTVPSPANAPPVPKLPARNATISVPGVAPSTAAHAGPPPPPSHPSSPSSRSRENTGPLPPPPLRSAMVNNASFSASPPRRSNSDDKEDEVYSDEEDDQEEATPIAGLSAQAKRLLEDFPDSTQANRRPPSFVPDTKIRDSTHHMSSYAVFGRYVCVGSHHVRIYDTQLSEHPIAVVDMKETGLDHKGKDPKITAMCFRPGATAAEEGRYLWCGTKDGHLWELDISTMSVSNTRSFAHATSICHIFRHRKMLLTLDDSGKLLVFEVGTAEGKTPALIRTLRVGEKFTFAKMLCGKLWTSSGPAQRSTTSSATARGPTVRIYDPCAAGTMPPAKSLFTTEWSGAVTAATYMPLQPEHIYLGHEGGFVSIWDAEALTCTQVLKISTTDILSLEGVGERLWAGNRKGQIQVFDINDRPWQTTNIWSAHPDIPVQTLIVDPYSIEYAGRYTCWSFARDALRAWDGLLSVDWIDKQMAIRQPAFCTFRDINVLVCSWNIDSAKPTELSGSEANSRFLEECLRSVDSPDIIVFGFQEVIPLTDKKLSAKTLLFGGKNKDSASTADKISPAYRQWSDKLQQAVRMAASPDFPYVKIHSESLVGLFTCIFVKSNQKDSLRDLDITTVKRGIGGIYGNKGAIVSRMIMDDTSLCFINVHLAAGQSQKSSRNADLAGIMEDKAIFPPSEEVPFVHGGDGTAILDHEMVILNGDLNYRIDQRRENVISSITAGELSYLLEHDQLRKEMRSNHAFRLRSFEEAPIEFAPTYKYDPGTHEYDSSEKRRIPAWCDRILYKKSDRIRSLNYRRYEPTVSDHKPISAGYTITLKAVDNLKMMDVRRDVTAEWAKKEKELLERMGEIFESVL
ncbi:hypothetical protein CI109_103444 [Kwoniella shandongensis]|uniref:Uncharacterized protein n=1 Tax=Kwoniella shandongensis TaxID=1734106 RepID=A0A5M6BXZ7_9TREE|nr:uncharacterized protein CI109_004524 [Kwoniella shandongensis]KAA5527231.1 hypothetical protein CI109_004524 [Kwoniella shandongensis]